RVDINLEDAILLGLEALLSTAEGIFNAATIEIGVVELSTRKFRELTYSEVENYVSKVTKQVSESKKTEKKKK
ncbi:MAG: proteasome subunit alpha, partial [Candidatus Methanoperedens sp.]|nr:proteasome subunit alpha [Candidatus Methanoperedens sp.]